MHAVAKCAPVLGLLVALSGCCSYQEFDQKPLSAVSWDGRGRQAADLSMPRKRIYQQASAGPAIGDNEKQFVGLKKYSPEWWSVRDLMNRNDEARLAKVITICHGCFEAVDRTASVTSASANK